LFAEPYICLHLPAILFATTHKNAKVRTAAEETAKLIVGKISPNASKVVLDHLYVAAEPGNQWQLRAVALNLIASFGDHAPEQLGVNLPDVIPQVTRSMHDPKKDISKAAFDAMTTACDVVGNRDIEHMTPKIVRAIMNQNEVNEIMHDLAGVTFVQSVQSPALAMVVPLLIRGLRSNKTATRRQSAVIIDNMSKLVDDPLDAAPFLPTLLPALAFAADAMSDPEARQVAENATAQLTKLNTICERLVQQNHGINHTQVRDMLLKKLPALDFELCVSHIAHLICSLMHLRKFEREDWVEITNYTVGLLQMTKAHAEQIVEEMRVACKELVKIVDLDGEDDDDAEELCNCQFTLAYGTKILLHNTNMRLKRGAKYGLLGGNDSGEKFD
jgi:elongation factor 3